MDHPFSKIFLAEIVGIVKGKNITICWRSFGIPSSGHSNSEIMVDKIYINIQLFLIFTTKYYHWIESTSCNEIGHGMRSAIYRYQKSEQHSTKSRHCQ